MEEKIPNEEHQIQEVKSLEMPNEAKGLCWGGFFLTFIWGFGHYVWFPLLVFVPFIGLAIPFYLLFKGREIAWKSREWNSIEEFKKSQKKWTIAGLTICFICLALLAFMFYAVFSFGNARLIKGRMSEAKIKLAAAYQLQYEYHEKKGHFTEFLENLDYDRIMKEEYGFYSYDPEKGTYGAAQHYSVGFASSGEKFKKYCPDCVATKDKFKMVAIGNIDDDDDLDIWTIDQDKLFVQIKSDK